jgi:hypothetical protein
MTLKGLADAVCHVIIFHYTQEARVHDAFDDVASSIWPAE